MSIVMNEPLRIIECLHYYVFLRIWENRTACHADHANIMLILYVQGL